MAESANDRSFPNPNEFDASTAAMDSRIALRSAISEALAHHGFADTLVLARERAADVFHERRLGILEYLSENDPNSVRELASALELDPGVVSRDLQRLAALDVVEYDDRGRAKAPRLKHEHVVVEPVVSAQ